MTTVRQAAPAEPVRRELSEVPRPSRWMLVGAIGLGLVGAVLGLVLGLDAYQATARFALLEIGIPAALLGGVLGFIANGRTAGGCETKSHGSDLPQSTSISKRSPSSG